MELFPYNDHSTIAGTVCRATRARIMPLQVWALITKLIFPKDSRVVAPGVSIAGSALAFVLGIRELMEDYPVCLRQNELGIIPVADAGGVGVEYQLIILLA